MTIDEAAAELARMHRLAGPSREQAVAIHLFGIVYAREIAGMLIREFGLFSFFFHVSFVFAAQFTLMQDTIVLREYRGQFTG
ncbi:HTH-like domain-containing protein [Oharaeibacter diazotrophicus]|uniref:HTH-like domain-containing protein n=1 Tax=Oharaeibacter diazotrophicus TaxID=1920512 RepID=A0A4R6RN85_9HYPH|nr:hypothetical protein [Oharaeibacter diazotrophicus]TDP87276.1 hypothetical protein EDD54_1165 [Oharaeibacter diazotrophicus]BBE70780.1 hypothetical protein OHA_1_00347 [Pleomorphomonas sp. SM30]GLS77529.1 hypothetical protein GCM10007904_28660 [Oharaeibacter diazotrophicus]